MTQYAAHYREDGDVQTVADHHLGVSRMASDYAYKIGLGAVGRLIGLLHDLGKCCEAFLKYIQSGRGLIDIGEEGYVDAKKMKGKIDHAAAGAQYLHSYLTAQKGKDEECIAQLLALCIASHHTGLIDCLSPEGTDNFAKRINKPEDETHLQESLKNLDSTIRVEIDNILGSTGLVEALRKTLGDDDAVNSSIVIKEFRRGCWVRFLLSCLIDADRTDTADFVKPHLKEFRNKEGTPDWNVLIERLEKHLDSFQCGNDVDVARRAISEQCKSFFDRPKGTYTLTVPTGGGKTLASLRFALHHANEHQMDRVVYVIPYTSIIDQNADVVRRILEDRNSGDSLQDRIVLEHHCNLTPEKETVRQSILAENWDAPIVYTTMVQFLEAWFGSGTRSARRLHRLANAVIIFDEIQTLPVRMVHLFNNAVNFLTQSSSSSVVLCTATQPLLGKVNKAYGAIELGVDSEMIKDRDQLFRDLKRVDIVDRRKSGGWSIDEVGALVRQEVVASKSVLIIANTKRTAVNLFNHLKENVDIPVYHLSTNMCPAHRMDRLKTITGRESDDPIICISTQLIEAGVDVDFGAVIRYAAGLDSIGQAAGRCNRHGRRASGRVTVVNAEDESLRNLRDIRIGQEVAVRVLDEYRENPSLFGDSILSPAAMERYFLYYFYERADEMVYPVEPGSLIERNDSLLSLLSINPKSVTAYVRNQKKEPPIGLRQSFMTAARLFQSIDSPTRGVIVPYGDRGRQIINQLCSTFDVAEQHMLLKAAQRYAVNVFPYDYARLKDLGAILEIDNESGAEYLHEAFYRDDIGLDIRASNEASFLHY